MSSSTDLVLEDMSSSSFSMFYVLVIKIYVFIITYLAKNVFIIMYFAVAIFAQSL